MNIAIIGYGRMGQTIEKLAIGKGHKIAAVIDVNNQDEMNDLHNKNIDVAIEFTQPHSAPGTIKALLNQGIPVVSGTTGWIEHMDEVKNAALDNNTGFFFAPNYSIGVNLFFAISEYAASLMNRFPEYDVHLEDVHHINKLDSPSGTAIHLAAIVIDKIDRKKTWVNTNSEKSEELVILSDRKPDVPGIHSTVFSGSNDTIELKHTASSRNGFASGAILAAEFLQGRKGIYNMKDLMETFEN